MLFSGDALMGKGDSLMAPTSFTCTDPQQAMASLKKLRNVSFSVIANGHTGAVYDGHAKLEAFLRERDRGKNRDS